MIPSTRDSDTGLVQGTVIPSTRDRVIPSTRDRVKASTRDRVIPSTSDRVIIKVIPSTSHCRNNKRTARGIEWEMQHKCTK